MKEREKIDHTGPRIVTIKNKNERLTVKRKNDQKPSQLNKSLSLTGCAVQPSTGVTCRVRIS